MSEAGVHRPHVGGIHGRSNDGAYSLVLAGGFEDEVVSFIFWLVYVLMRYLIDLSHAMERYKHVGKNVFLCV